MSCLLDSLCSVQPSVHVYASEGAKTSSVEEELSQATGDGDGGVGALGSDHSRRLHREGGVGRYASMVRD